MTAAAGSGPLSEQVGPEASGSLGVNEQVALEPETAQDGLNVGGASGPVVTNGNVVEPELPAASVPETVNV